MRRRLPNVPSSGTTQDDPTTVSRISFDTVILGALSATQILLLLVLSTVILSSLKGEKARRSDQKHSLGGTFKSRESLAESTTSPTLSELLDVVVKAFERQEITYWFMPGLNILSDSRENGEGRVTGKLSPSQEGVDLGVFQDDLMNVIQVQTQLQGQGIVAVESHFGLRIFSEMGYEDPRYDYRTPFVDVVYFKEEGEYVVSPCCDCEPSTIGVCSKKTCDCMACLAKSNDIFPLTVVKIEGISSALKAPRRSDIQMLRDKSNSSQSML
eukprot:gb/GEZJ01005608.1/.p1 GENE.gb/GEZJ01005608.1/~~gb/GEZJ01005608.1/.p1  ORF type:complete len:270 (-),score=32.72 gb/GEZJ01005608.1/:709-1518(-)